MTADGTKVIRVFASDANGKFEVQVVPGTYTIGQPPTTSMLPRCGSNETISVTADNYASTTVYCDTGIR